MNRLSKEKSPYLLQHANNPVDWYPWGDAAFEKARVQNKPVFLSIGYATCHWCHVMEHESFEDEEVALLMNEAFINIKVDREERPDIDNTYMTICQMLTGQGGWPLTIIMTPDKEPFYAATYLPKSSIPNRIGMLDLISSITDAWENDQTRIMESVERIKKGFEKSLELGNSNMPLSESILNEGYQSLIQRYDRVNGGFGGAPKFPSPHNLLFLFDYSTIHNDTFAAEMVENTLLNMRLGGIWDHVGGGFHRYSTDESWLLPHFEKMLYDQAMLLLAYARGWKLTGKPLFKQTGNEIVYYLDECLTSPNGAFYSAEDADSEGVEGKFYVWTKSEIESILRKDAPLFCEHYQIEEGGNFRDEATHEKTGLNIPHLKKLVPVELLPKTEPLLRKLHKKRNKRVRPLLDDKILTDWNGLMIAALARAGVSFEKTQFIEKAEDAWTVISENCFIPGDKLLHRLKDGDAEIEGMADDYVFSIWGLIELYDATFNPNYLAQAVNLQEILDRKFYDGEKGGYFFTAHEAEEILGRQKEIYDGAIPSSNSVAALNGFRLSRLTGNPVFESRARTIFKAFAEPLNDSPGGYSFALLAHQIMNHDTNEVIVCSREMDDTVKKVIQLLRNRLPIGSSILLKTAATNTALGIVSDFSKSCSIEEGLSVYVCSDFSCRVPVHSLEELEEMFGE